MAGSNRPSPPEWGHCLHILEIPGESSVSLTVPGESLAWKVSGAVLQSLGPTLFAQLEKWGLGGVGPAAERTGKETDHPDACQQQKGLWQLDVK